jgi:prepilin-type N-terminal cleavage/methylation domain-containing protein
VPALPTSALAARRNRRGFTLIELMVVVVIIAILAVIAVPLFAARFAERRLQQAALHVAELYRGARARALGRGAAILVKKDGDKFTVLEGVRGTTAATAAGNATCGNLPTRGCITNDWDSIGTTAGNLGTARVIDEFEFGTGTTSTTSGAEITDETMSICFSPAGQTWLKHDGAWESLHGAVKINVTNSVRNYDVVVLPNGTARLGK